MDGNEQSSLADALLEPYSRNALDGPTWQVKPFGSGYPRKPWEWTNSYPNLAAFLRTALHYAPLAFPLPPLARVPIPGEWPTSAAIRIGDRTFTGNSHFDALGKAQTALGENVLSQPGANAAIDGFLTNKGRYVSREEAGRLLDALNQTCHYKTWLGDDKKGKAGLLSEALELYDPMTGREK